MSEFPTTKSSYIPAQVDVRFDIAPNWVVGFTVKEDNEVEVWVSATPLLSFLSDGVSVREPMRIEKAVSKQSVIEFQNALRKALITNTEGAR